MFYIKNTNDRYGLGAVFLHWLLAIIILMQIFLGWFMTDLPNNATKLKLFGWHKEIGVLILMLAVIRILWRLVNVIPSLDELPLYERIGARAVHWVMYVFMFMVPLTGWVISSAADLPISFFGLFVLPNIVTPNEKVQDLFGQVHAWLAYSFLTVIVLHVAAALKHYLIDKDQILQRMLP